MPVTGTSTMVLYAPTGGTGLLAPCGTALCRHGIWYRTWLLGCTVYRPVPGPRTGPECTVGIRTISIVPQLLTDSRQQLLVRGELDGYYRRRGRDP
jgi:hypothetical protein